MWALHQPAVMWSAFPSASSALPAARPQRRARAAASSLPRPRHALRAAGERPLKRTRSAARGALSAVAPPTTPCPAAASTPRLAAGGLSAAQLIGARHRCTNSARSLPAAPRWLGGTFYLAAHTPRAALLFDALPPCKPGPVLRGEPCKLPSQRAASVRFNRLKNSPAFHLGTSLLVCRRAPPGCCACRKGGAPRGLAARARNKSVECRFTKRWLAGGMACALSGWEGCRITLCIASIHAGSGPFACYRSTGSEPPACT